MADLHAVPDTDWVDQAKAKYDQIKAIVMDYPIDEETHDLLAILVHATLAGAPIDELQEIAKICAALVFLPGSSE